METLKYVKAIDRFRMISLSVQNVDGAIQRVNDLRETKFLQFLFLQVNSFHLTLVWI